MVIKIREWMKYKRKRLGLAQTEISAAVGISRQYYNAIENGKRRPSPEKAKKIAEILDFDWRRFYENKEEPPAD